MNSRSTFNVYSSDLETLILIEHSKLKPKAKELGYVLLHASLISGKKF